MSSIVSGQHSFSEIGFIGETDGVLWSMISLVSEMLGATETSRL